MNWRTIIVQDDTNIPFDDVTGIFDAGGNVSPNDGYHIDEADADEFHVVRLKKSGLIKDDTVYLPALLKKVRMTWEHSAAVSMIRQDKELMVNGHLLDTKDLNCHPSEVTLLEIRWREAWPDQNFESVMHQLGCVLPKIRVEWVD